MAHNGNRYPEEFKRQIIDLYLSGKSVTELANEYDLVEQTISIKEYKDLQKKMRELEMENEILKKLQPYSQKAITELPKTKSVIHLTKKAVRMTMPALNPSIL